VLFTPSRHEQLASQRFDEAAAQKAIARIVARAELELDPRDGRWPLDADDAVRPDEGPACGLYCGAAGVFWALGELGAELDREQVERLERKLVDEPDDPDLGVGGVWSGVPGVLAVAERHWPDASRRDRIEALARTSLTSPALEVLYGHPGHMVLAAQLHACTGEERWATFWADGAQRLLDDWQYDDALDAWLWTPQVGRDTSRYLGAAHGLAGNVHALLRGARGLLDADRRTDVERRALHTLSRLAVVEDGRVNWPPVAGDPLVGRGGIRVQWCHGAAGVLITLWDTAPDNDDWSELLVQAGHLVFEAGPIRDQPGLCHGTAGNAYALLAVWRRTGDDEWLARARACAAHAAAQVEERAERLGHGHHSLFTGDEGVALCMRSCLTGDERFPISDRLV
jgi:Lanthionine synthetase C-like protein